MKLFHQSRQPSVELCDDILKKIDENGGYVVPSGFLNESYQTDLHVALRHLAKEYRIMKIAPPPDSFASALAQFPDQEVWGRGRT